MELNSILLSVVCILVLGYYYIKRKYSYFTERGIAHQKPEFPFGNVKGLSSKYNQGAVVQRCYNAFKGKEVIAGMYFFTKPVVVTIDLDLLKNIFVKDFHNFTDHGFYYNKKDDPLSAHLFSIEGNEWKTLRTKLTPTFTSGKMRMMYSTLLVVADQLKDYLATKAEMEKEIEIKEILAQFSTDIIGSVAFGIDCNSLRHPDNAFRKAGRRIFDLSVIDHTKVFLTMMYPKLARKIGLTLNNSDQNKFFMTLIKETVDYRERNNVQRNDFMTLLLQIKNTGKLDGENVELGTLTFEELAAQTFVFFAGGFETSSSIMTFALYELALNQDIQDRARQEVRDVLEKHNGVFSYDAMMSMPYLDQIINETLRKYPVVENLLRKANNDYLVPNTKHVIEKDTIVMIPAFAIHRDPEIYPNPDVFDPDRFTPENIAKRHPLAWIPFGEGPRNCIGIRFGLMQTRVGLATVLNNFAFSPTKRLKVPMEFSPSGFVLSSKEGVYLKITSVK